MHRRIVLITILSIIALTSFAKIVSSTGKPVRFVAPEGTSDNDGRSWSTAKKDIQDAINDLANMGLKGEVWVKVGTYRPTQSTDPASDDVRNKSFVIPAGIIVRGGFAGNEDTELTGKAAVDAGKTGREMNNALSSSVGEHYKNRSILTGSLDDRMPTFIWDDTRQEFSSRFDNCSYHVVTFAANGFDEEGRAKPLGTTQEMVAADGEIAKLEGFVVMNGCAGNTTFEGHPHNAYGGGVYMVPGSCIENIYIYQCEASRDGGAVYLDGGGLVNHCYIANCQSMGIDERTGFGGGIAIDENRQIYPPVVKRTSIVNCSARYGGGLATRIHHTDLIFKTPNKDYDMRYNIGVSSVFIANCVASTEGGGIFAYKGGSFTQLTIVNNRCNGNGRTIENAETGKSAGMFICDYGIVGNSLLWGGINKRDKDAGLPSAQFGSMRTTTKALVEVRYVAMNNANVVDWSGVEKIGLIKISGYNTHADAVKDSVDENISYPAFLNPSKTVGHEEGASLKNYKPFIYTIDKNTGEKIISEDGYSYKVAYSSGAAVAGVYTKDLDTEGKSPAKDVTQDIQGIPFSSFPTIGAYTSESPSMLPSVEWTKYDGTKGLEAVLHVYVDPASTYADDEENAGSSWLKPIRHLRDALETISNNLQNYVKDADYDIKEIQIHVKEGIVDLNGTSAKGYIRNNSLVIPNTKIVDKNGISKEIPLKLIGGYTKFLGVDDKYAGMFPSSDIYHQANQLSERNPIQTPTIVSGAVLHNYKYSIPHLVVIDGKENVTIDGFQLRCSNATSDFHITKPISTGAALTVNNSKNVKIKNVLIADCKATNGAAIYSTNSNIEFENCIFHNNTVDFKETSGIIYSDASSSLMLNHCDVLRNVGYAFYNLGNVRIENSVVYSNTWKSISETNDHDSYMLPAFKGSGKFTSSTQKNMFDIASKKTSGIKFAATGTGIEAQVGKTILEFSFGTGNNYNYPFFCNPTRTSGISENGDIDYYARSTSFQPHSGSPLINAASTDDLEHSEPNTSDVWGSDMSTMVNRDWGGLPDIGAVESHQGKAIDEGDLAYTDGQRMYGSIIYVKDYHTYDKQGRRLTSSYKTEGLDGTSWSKAINGNGKYKKEDGTLINGLQYAIDMAHEIFEESGDQQTIWISEGKYTNSSAATSESHNQPYAYIMREGVDVYGGFPSQGSPGMEQRKTKSHATILQSSAETPSGKAMKCEASVGRVLVQPENFNTETTWHGVRLRRGYLCSAYRQQMSDNPSGVNIKEIGEASGAGAYLMKNSVLEKCVIEDNMILTQPYAATQTISGNDIGEFLEAGAGIYNIGGTLKSCTITGNTLLHRLNSSNGSDAESTWMYGAGLFMADGTVYNTIICNNKATVDANGRTASSEVLAGAGMCIAAGHFYNNTIADNKASTISSQNINISVPGVFTLKNVGIYNSIISGNISEGSHEGSGSNVYNAQLASFDQDYNPQPDNVQLINCCLDLETVQAFPSQSIRNNIAMQNAINCIYSNPHLERVSNREIKPYYLASTSPAINAGTEDVGDGINLPDVDAENGDRIHDCVVDMGAYEFNDAYAITPDLREKGKAVFYVTPYGTGNASASSPTNAACADKLQLVIDAAGRYKYQNPNKKVLVKVANAKSLAKANKSQRDTINYPYYNHFCYYATRATDKQDVDIRNYSIVIPRGVEVLGGYTDTGSKGNYNDVTDADNGFYIYKKGKRQDNRDIFGNATYFDGFYYNIKNSTTSTTYHVVSFTDMVFDSDGNPYLEGDEFGKKSNFDIRSNYNEEKFISLSSKVTDRAIIDGIFIADGLANIESSGYFPTSNGNQYGGAAIVPGYAHIRKCILRGNSAVYGGALALRDSALVDGCIIDRNSALYGGGVYIMKDSTRLSARDVVNTGKNASSETRMPKIFCSTIANNTATDEGGGIWFSDDYANVRVNSTVVWHNNGKYENNVFGAYSPEKPQDDSTKVEDYYPFAYSAIENIRMSGVNNITVAHDNDKGVRFANQNDYSLTNYSALLACGMPKDKYNIISKTYDFSKRSINSNLRATSFLRTYTEIGAQSQDRILPMTHLMLRLYVAKPDNVDIKAANAMMALKPEEAKSESDKNIRKYYQQEGSSFAYPFQNIQEALDYIVFMRSISRMPKMWQEEFRKNIKDIDKAANMPFEIFVAKGTYYPTKNLEGLYGESLANTFSIPEGVSIYGGFDAMDLSNTQGHKNEFYGGYQAPAENVVIPEDSTTEYHMEDNLRGPKAYIKGRHIHLGEYKINICDTKTILASRSLIDHNNDGEVSPWEFKNETILSGNSVNNNTNGVYHVITVVPDENVVGILPRPVTYNGRNGKPVYNVNSSDFGYVPFEYGQSICLDGITIADGNAHNIKNADMDEVSKNYFYHGGGLLVDGNRYNNHEINKYYDVIDYNNAKNDSLSEKTFKKLRKNQLAKYMHSNHTNAVGYRNIPITLSGCTFYNNEAGYGAAISSNTDLKIKDCIFEYNTASGGTETETSNGEKINVFYPGQGGAIFSTCSLTADNTWFFHNKAKDENLSIDLVKPISYRNQDPSQLLGVLPGCGGAIYSGRYGKFHLSDCKITYNTANVYPAVFTMNPNNEMGDSLQYNQIKNTLFVRNEVHADMMAKYKDNRLFTFAAPLICNYGFRQRKYNDTYSPEFIGFQEGVYNKGVPSSQKELDSMMETVWFSTYEKERGMTTDGNIEASNIIKEE